MNKRKIPLTADAVFVMLLFLTFALTVLFVLISGANIYKQTARVMQERYEERTCIAYITQKIRHYDSKDAVYLTDIDGIQALAMDETVNNTTYSTKIYYYKGYVKEITSRKELKFKPESGSNIIKAKNLSFEVQKNNPDLVKIKCTAADGKTSEILINLRSFDGGVSNE